MDEELRFHVEMETEKHVRAGLDPHEARRRALVAFGGVERHRERLREGRGIPLVEPLFRDVRFAVRGLGREPILALVASLTIALGVGATTSVFSVVNAVLLRPLPIPDVERLRIVREERSGAISTGVEGMRIAFSRYQTYREGTGDVFESMAAQRLDVLALRLDDVTLSVNGALTSGNYFSTLGVRPILGRSYSADDAPEIVISYDLWLARFGGSAGAVGSLVHLDGRAVSVVGVAPPGYRGATVWPDDLWVPVRFRDLDPEAWGMRVVPFGRLADGVGAEAAEARVHALGTRVPAEPQTTVRAVHLEPVTTVPAQGRGAVQGFLAMLLGMALLVLLIASANIAGVMLARAFARRREVAVRMALGSGRARLVRHLLTESLLLFALGGVAGVGLAVAGTRWLSSLPLPPQVPIVLDFAPDLTVLAFALVVTGITGVVFGLIPAVQASRPDLVPALKAGGHGASAGDGRLRYAFVGGQVAFAVLLLLTATLFARSLRAGLRADLGFDPAGVVVATVDLGPPHEYDADGRERFFRTLVEGVRESPGVEKVALGAKVLLSGDRESSDVRVPGDPEGARGNAAFNWVDEAYLETMGVVLVAGRWIAASDVEGSAPVAVVNQRLADMLFPGQNPLGQRITSGLGGEREIVGVARDGRYVFITESPAAYIYLPYAQARRSVMALHVKAPGAEGAALRAIADQVRALDPDVALHQAAPLGELIGFSLFPHRFAAQLVGVFGLVGLILAAMGIYGVLAFQVARRSREFGVRRALGARAADIVRLVVGGGGLVALGGCLAGMAGGAVIAKLLQSFLFGIEPLDAATFLGVPLLLAAVALIASLAPALRATRVEAVVALREE
jgi:predicted permease